MRDANAHASGLRLHEDADCAILNRVEYAPKPEATACGGPDPWRKNPAVASGFGVDDETVPATYFAALSPWEHHKCTELFRNT